VTPLWRRTGCARTAAAEDGAGAAERSRVILACAEGGFNSAVAADWFAELTNRKLRRSAHRSGTELENDIRKWVNEWNKDQRPFAWTKAAGEILAALAAYCSRVSSPGCQ
jgi:hypothetical protein